MSGGNIDVTTLGRVISSGLIASGRLCSIHIEVNDQPGTLAQTCAIVSKLGANIISVHHDRAIEQRKCKGMCGETYCRNTQRGASSRNKIDLKEKGFQRSE